MSALAAAIWVDLLLRRAGRPELALRAHELLYVVALVGMATVGAVLAGRRPRHPVGWLMLALGLSVIVDGVTDGYARYGLLASPGSVPAVRHIRPLGDTFVLWPACIGFILLLTPTGSLPSRRWRWWAAIAVVAPLSWQAATVLGVESVEFPPFYSFPNPYFVPALAAPAMAVALPALVITLLLGLGYAAVVLGLGRLLGRDSSLVVAAATLAVAAAFQPARRPIQRLVDRRFNRRHDAGRIIGAFGARLRDQVDLDTLTAEVMTVVDQTMQPTTAWLWLRRQAPSTSSS
jgi:hypothetical protein